jgi:hypothetical protein
MTAEEIQKAITEGISAAFKDPATHCRYRISPQQHDEDHLFIRQFVVNMGKVSDIKFFVLRWLVVAILSVVSGWAAFGLIHKYGLGGQ